MASLLRNSKGMAEHNFAFMDDLFFNDPTTSLKNIRDSGFDKDDLEIYKRAFRNKGKINHIYYYFCCYLIQKKYFILPNGYSL